MACSGLTSLTIPNSVTSISELSFAGCSELSKIIVEQGNSIYDSREECNAIITTSTNTILLGCKSTTYPNSVTAIGNNAFYGASKLTSIVIPENVITIGHNAFRGCRLENIITRNINTEFIEAIYYSATPFSTATLNHAILYVPLGQRWEAIYAESGWYQFNNIREIAMEAREVSPARAYTLMNTKTFDYTVYDGVNNRMAKVRSLYDLEEDNPVNSWQVVERDGKNFLYNIGARKFASISTNGEIALSSEPKAITMQESENGFILGSNPDQQWAFVLNEKVQADASVTALNDIIVENNEREEFFSIDGLRISQPKKGINIIRTNDGKMRKVMMK